MYPESVYKFGSDVIEQLGNGVQRRDKLPARINTVINNSPKFWLSVEVIQNNQNQWCFSVSVSSEIERFDDYGDSKYVVIDSKKGVNFYVTQLNRIIKSMKSKLNSEFGDTGQSKMFEGNRKWQSNKYGDWWIQNGKDEYRIQPQRPGYIVEKMVDCFIKVEA